MSIMENANETAKQLAELYGISYVATSESAHSLVVASDGTTEPLTDANFRDVFGIRSPLLETLVADISTYENMESRKQTISSEELMSQSPCSTNFQGSKSAVGTELTQRKTSLALAA